VPPRLLYCVADRVQHLRRSTNSDHTHRSRDRSQNACEGSNEKNTSDRSTCSARQHRRRFRGGNTVAKGARVYFLTLKVGATVKSPFKVQFGLSGMGVAPEGVNKAKTGLHHLLIDKPALGKGPNGKEELTANLPADKHHKHFGGGQTETMVTLSPGKHTLSLVLGDMNHIPFNPLVVSQRISVTVK
jgi:hypothetical protein